MLQETNGDTSRDLRLDSDDIADPINDRLTLAERNERLQGQLKSLKDELATTRQVGSQQPLIDQSFFGSTVHLGLDLSRLSC